MSNQQQSRGYFMTGGLGCIGVWVVRNLVRDNISVTIFDISKQLRRLRLILEDDEIDRINFIQGDISDYETVEKAIDKSGAAHIIHLAALQIPDCAKDPVLGAKVNVVGTLNVFESAVRLGLERVVYASSMAVYGNKDDYDLAVLPHDAPLKPVTHYGIFKQANEGAAEIYFKTRNLTTIGIRPFIVYGPGRDQGFTSFVTGAMLAAAAGKEFAMPVNGRMGMQYADDVAKIFIAATTVPYSGSEVYNIKGDIASMDEIVAAIEKVEPLSRGKISVGAHHLQTIEGMDDAEIRKLLGAIPETHLETGIAETISVFKKAIAEEKIAV